MKRFLLLFLFSVLSASAASWTGTLWIQGSYLHEWTGTISYENGVFDPQYISTTQVDGVGAGYTESRSIRLISETDSQVVFGLHSDPNKANHVTLSKFTPTFTASGSYTNETNESVAFEFGVFDESGNLVDVESVWLEPGDSFSYNYSEDEPFSVGIRETTSNSDGWSTSEWVTEEANLNPDASGDTPSTTGTTENPLNPNNINPELPYDPTLDTDGQQIIDAIEKDIGNTNARISALRDFISYLNNGSRQRQQATLEAVNARGTEILDAVNSIPVEDYGDDFLQVQAAISTIQGAVNDLPAEIALWANLNNTAIEDVGDKVDIINNKVDYIQHALDSEDDTAIFTSLQQTALAIEMLANSVGDLDGTGEHDLQAVEQLQAINQNTSQTAQNVNSVGSAVTAAANGTNDILEQIRDKTDPNSALLEQIRDNTTEATVDDSGTSSVASSAADSITDSAQDFINSNPAPSISVTGLAFSQSIFPTVNLPVLGQISLNPFEHFNWLESFLAWVRSVVVWVSSAVFLRWFWAQLSESVQSIGQTPVQSSSGGGATGAIAAGKQIATASLFVGVCLSAIVLAISLISDPAQGIIAQLSAQFVLTAAAPSVVLSGLGLVNLFCPIEHLLFLLTLSILVRQAQIPAILGVMVLIRLTSV